MDQPPNAEPPPIAHPVGSPSPAPARSSRRRRTAVVLAAVLVAAVVLSFGLGRSSGRSSPARSATGVADVIAGSSSKGDVASTTVGPRGESGDVARSGTASPTASAAAPDKGGVAADPIALTAAKIVKTASLDLAVGKGAVSTTFNRLTTLAAGSGGFVSQQQTSEAGGSPSGTITIRVPSAAFERVLAEARQLGKVQSATTGGQDVTNEYTDVDGRLKSLADERAQLQLVLGTADNVPDILSVRDRLTTVQTEIEQLQGRKNVLDDQISLATLAVSVHEKGTAGAPIPTVEPTGFAKAWHDAAHGFNSGLQAIIAGSGRTVVVLLVGLVLFLVGRVVLRVGRRHLDRPSTGTAPTPTA